ncbi:uncharacterized protein LOC9637363 [Selaginella moellendorffii]|uniref:uncharacterized protein LOC9637363 n=1 Tax=Selaginella moellendorffii TaxID=88036 RepID=UPI000D1C9634|nr:uncharacterized protein LOC9637363 [Selaginella moellendorffii]|eukprot:XP_024535301.1 uncharacterized protein LOC9637363 [Selaginella moellendorffii]
MPVRVWRDIANCSRPAIQPGGLLNKPEQRGSGGSRATPFSCQNGLPKAIDDLPRSLASKLLHCEGNERVDNDECTILNVTVSRSSLKIIVFPNSRTYRSDSWSPL